MIKQNVVIILILFQMCVGGQNIALPDSKSQNFIDQCDKASLLQCFRSATQLLSKIYLT